MSRQVPRRSGRLALAVAAGLLLASCSGEPPAGEATDRGRGVPERPVGGTALAVPRAVHEATVLDDGRVLVTGGCTRPGCEGFEEGRPSEVFDPVTGRFGPGPSMASPRAGHTATLLGDGRVLLAGGYPGEGRAPLATAEVFDPATGEIVPAGELSVGRADHSATVLADGRVLLAGGTSPAGDALRSTEVFDPGTDRFEPGPELLGPRSGHAAVLSSGRLVLVGGTSDLDSAVATTEVLDGATWSPGPVLLQARVKHAASALPDGRVLVVGGAETTEGRDLLASTELLDVGAGRSTPGPALSEGQYKLDGAVTTLADGRVVIAGGRWIEVYDPATGAMSVLDGAPAPRRSFRSASAVTGSTVLVAGGYDSAVSPTADARLVRVL